MKRLLLLIIFTPGTVFAQTPQCMTATLPVVYELCDPSAGAVAYDWYDSVSGAKLIRTTEPRVQISQVSGPIRLYAIPIGSNGSEGPKSVEAIPLLATKPFGFDFDGNGSVNAQDFGGANTGLGFKDAFLLGCRSCAAKDLTGLTICTCPTTTN